MELKDKLNKPFEEKEKFDFRDFIFILIFCIIFFILFGAIALFSYEKLYEGMISKNIRGY